MATKFKKPQTKKIHVEGQCTCNSKESAVTEHSLHCALWEVDGWVEGHLVWHEGELWDAEELWGFGAEYSQRVVEGVADLTPEERFGEPVATPDSDGDTAEAEVVLTDEQLMIHALAHTTPEDQLYECTCFDPDDDTVRFSTWHSTSCMLFAHTAWVMHIADWHHPTRTFVYWQDPVVLEGMDEDPQLEKAKKKADAANMPQGWDPCSHGKFHYCTECGLERKGKDPTWFPITKLPTPKTTTSTAPKKKTKTKGVTSAIDDDWAEYAMGLAGGGYSKCRHYSEELVFPSGVRVFPSSHFKRNYDDPIPDFAVYLDNIWAAWSAALYIPWKDHGLPEIPLNRAAEFIVDAYNLAELGQSVEIGCIGGHGRTGTVLACMAVLAGVPGKDAADWVWKNYCTKAIESAKQEWFILWFDAWWHGTVAPPMPAPPAPWKGKGSDGGKKGGSWVGSKDDLKFGDPCPGCKTKLAHYTTKDYKGLSCNNAKCTHHKNLARCPDCGVYLDAHDRQGYCCWKTGCKFFATKEKDTSRIAAVLAQIKSPNLTWLPHWVKTSK